MVNALEAVRVFNTLDSLVEFKEWCLDPGRIKYVLSFKFLLWFRAILLSANQNNVNLLHMVVAVDQLQ